MTLAFENVTKASHLNIVKDVINAIGSQMAMQSSIFGRLGNCEALAVVERVSYTEVRRCKLPSHSVPRHLCRMLCWTISR